MEANMGVNDASYGGSEIERATQTILRGRKLGETWSGHAGKQVLAQDAENPSREKP